MTPEERQAARARCEAATPEPWEWDVNTYDAVWGPDGDQICKCWGNLALGTEADDDAQFITAARTDLRAALDEIERLEGENATLERLLTEAKTLAEWWRWYMEDTYSREMPYKDNAEFLGHLADAKGE